MVLLIAIVVLGALRESEEIRRSERVKNGQIAKALSIEKLVVDLETGQRGSIISGKEEFLEAGMSDYLAKPLDRTALRLALQRWLQPRAP